MSTIHAQVILPALSGMPEDAAMNGFTFTAAVPAADLAAAVEPELINFYNTASGVNPVAGYIARNRDRATDACEIKYFDITAHLSGSAAGPPFLISPWTLGTYLSSDAMPEEVAIALSFHGAFGSLSEFAGGARPKARRRGRVFIGPIVLNAGSTAAPAYQSRPSANLQGDVLASGQALMDAAVGWAVWSRRNAATYPVVGGWVDDSWDTIRGRGPAPTFKDTFGSIV